MVKGKSTWKYNKLLTARKKYFVGGGPVEKLGPNPSTFSIDLPAATPPNISDFSNINIGTSTGLDNKWNAAKSLIASSPVGKAVTGAAGIIENKGLGPVVSAAGSAIGGAISGGLESGAGNAINGLANIASAIPGPYGALASGALKVVGGLTNKMFGSKLNEENIAAVESGISSANNFQSNASSYDTLAGIMGSTADLSDFSDSYIGKDGWFSNKAGNKAAELRKLQDTANLRQQLALINNAENIASDTMDNLQSSYMALGGPLYFGNGGKIHIKPENRGKFTETKRRTGKTTEELTHSKNPLTRKRAIFALNSRHWNKHSNGGTLDKDEINPGLDAMVKARLALDSHFGNPTARRMTNYDTRSYIFPDGRRGNVYVGSYGNYVTPQIQDVDGELKFIEDPWNNENWERSEAQSMKFESPRDSEYFAKNYKRFAPMMSLYSKGGKLNSNSYQVGQVYDVDEVTINKLKSLGYEFDIL